LLIGLLYPMPRPTSSISSLDFLTKKEGHIIANVLWFGAWVIAHEGLAATGDEELLPVPPDVLHVKWTVVELVRLRKAHTCRWTICLEVCVEWVRVLPIHLNLLEHGEVGLEPVSWPHILDAVVQLCIVSSWLLLSKLVTREGQHFKVIEGIV